MDRTGGEAKSFTHDSPQLKQTERQFDTARAIVSLASPGRRIGSGT